ncbi:MAG: aminopeptidase [Candidatus Marinimicrobia bacterium]|nr:aminopeptidase [Candidatus Neomarinimicrobiota bacterium]
MTKKNDLAKKRANIWDTTNDKQSKDIHETAEAYKDFLNEVKTEREAVNRAVSDLEKHGFKHIDSVKSPAKIYIPHMSKSLAAFVPGKSDISEGLNIIVAHIDSPRLDLKPSPLYEDQGLAFFKTHYYGGIKKYQWLSRALALHGVIFLKDGKKVDVRIGEDDNDPVFTIGDLLPHLAGKAQMDKKANEFIEAEKLNIIIGSKPAQKNKKNDDDIKDPVKMQILTLLNERYGIKECDFASADLEIVPAGKVRDLGLDRSMLAGYGHDDRICSWAGLEAVINAKNPEKPALLLLLDKEEIGSTGATGANSWLLEVFVGRILSLYGKDQYNTMLTCLSSSACLSADVNAAVHPDWISVHDKLNAAWLNEGVVLTKYTGVRGKAGSSEASPEFIAALRVLFDKNDIAWQTAELGKTDEGGGGTIAMFMAYYGMQVIDLGVGLIDMHSPFEIASKADLYMMKKAYTAFFNDYSGLLSAE